MYKLDNLQRQGLTNLHLPKLLSSFLHRVHRVTRCSPLLCCDSTSTEALDSRANTPSASTTTHLRLISLHLPPTDTLQGHSTPLHTSLWVDRPPHRTTARLRLVITASTHLAPTTSPSPFCTCRARVQKRWFWLLTPLVLQLSLIVSEHHVPTCSRCPVRHLLKPLLHPMSRY